VVFSGDVYINTTFPVINVEQGGTLNGVIAAVNRIIEITVPKDKQEAGTYVIPGHGRIADEADVVEYRDMLTIVRDRIQDAIKKGMTLQQVKAARLARDYEGRYGATQGAWTTDAFIEAAYRTLTRRRHGSQRGEAGMKHRVARLACRRRSGRGGGRCLGTARGGGAPTVAAAERADRSHRLLGVDRQRGLAVAHGDAAEGRRGQRADQRRGTQDRRVVGSESSMGIVPRLRRGRPDAHADAAQHHLGRNDRTLKIDTDAGVQTRRQLVERPAVAALAAIDAGAGRLLYGSGRGGRLPAGGFLAAEGWRGSAQPAWWRWCCQQAVLWSRRPGLTAVRAGRGGPRFGGPAGARSAISR
jgi:hypothetical protein